MNQLIEAPHVPDGIPVTAVMRLRNGHLHEAAKRLGSQAKLAAALKVEQITLSQWINLKSCPPAEPTPRWPARRIRRLERALLRITGKTLEEVFPQELRDNVQFLRSPKSFERTVNIRATALEAHANATRERLESYGDPSAGEEEEHNHKTLQGLMRDARLSERESQVIALKYNDGQTATMEEIGHALGVSKSRAQQIEKKALEKLRKAAGLPPEARPATVEAENEPIIIDAESEPATIDAGNPPSQPDPAIQERRELLRTAEQAERNARGKQGRERREGLLQASHLYREGGLIGLAEDIMTEANKTPEETEGK